jgi:GDP-D-mannose dehydratase
MWLMLQQKKADDYVIGTGKSHSIKQFINLVCKNLDLKIGDIVKLGNTQFEFIGFGSEREHLKQHTVKDTEKLKEKVLELSKQGRSLREIGAELGISHMNAKRILNTCNKL